MRISRQDAETREIQFADAMRKKLKDSKDDAKIRLSEKQEEHRVATHERKIEFMLHQQKTQEAKVDAKIAEVELNRLEAEKIAGARAQDRVWKLYNMHAAAFVYEKLRRVIDKL